MSKDFYRPEDWEKIFYPPYDDPSYNKDGWHLAHWFGDKRHFRPWYDDDADYNVNAKSYYDYLGFRLAQFEELLKAINQLLRRNIQTKETNTIKLTKTGDWSSVDVITLDGICKISKHELNAMQALDDGLYTEDLKPLIERVRQELQDQINNLKTRLDNSENRVNTLETEVNNLKQRVTNLEQLTQKHDRVLRKIVQSLANNGSWHAEGDLLDGDFNQGHGVASGTINLFGGVADGGSYIRTNSGHTENDLTGGI